MAAIRAYYLPADPASVIDASHPVSVAKLNALGWKITSVAGGPDEIEQAGRKFAQELGFPITQEGSALTPEMAAFLMQAAEAENTDLCIANGVGAAVMTGNLYIDVEDIAAAGQWVRLHLDAGTLVSVPTGAKYRFPFNEKTKGTTGIGFFKETVSNPGLVAMKEIDNHPARHAYLKEVLGET
ncbi:hypothetical protein BDP27DRAFT_1424505 [Rhodocollybia butyracea]|uniref:Uncharacterized protein n=1 Tax=Rhodocollybia butyracea TaxID=206335 RepID=A0A9P5PLW4_9AGAR|nr:hypothetical protein BDP27DRAFT_1424505 [Rhodocollybia butyracea]